MSELEPTCKRIHHLLHCTCNLHHCGSFSKCYTQHLRLKYHWTKLAQWVCKSLLSTWLTRGPPISLIPLFALALVFSGWLVILTAGILMTVTLSPALVLPICCHGGCSDQWPQPGHSGRGHCWCESIIGWIFSWSKAFVAKCAISLIKINIV